MKSHRMMFAAAGTLCRFTWALLQSAPTLIMANHLYAAPFGAQLDTDFDSAAASSPSPCFSAELRALEGDTLRVDHPSEIRAARLSGLHPPPGESS
jgi:hypothetical protein